MRYLSKNIRFAGDGCYSNHCRPNREGQSVCQNFASVKNATKSCRTKKGSPTITFVGERCVGIAKSFFNPNKHRCYMKPIVNQEEDSGEVHSKRNKEKKGQRKRSRVSRGDDWSRRRRRRRRHARREG